MPSGLYTYSFTTRMHDIDAAGVVFFARFFYHIHNAYEDFLNHHHSGISTILNTDYILPIKHSEADFKVPVLLNETIVIHIFLAGINTNEFSLSYHLYDTANKLRAKAFTQHICLDRETKKRKVLPDSLTKLLLKNNQNAHL